MPVRPDRPCTLAAARESADLDAMTSLRNRADSIGDLVTTLSGLRKAAQDRADRIGDGTAVRPGDLAAAQQAADNARAALRRLLNTAYPERPEAVSDRLMDDFQAALQGNLERIAEEGKPQPPQRAVYL